MISGVYAVVAVSAVGECPTSVVFCYLLTHRDFEVYAHYVHASPLASDRSLRTKDDTCVSPKPVKLPYTMLQHDVHGRAAAGVLDEVDVRCAF